mgnify:CR=1 FL=1
MGSTVLPVGHRVCFVAFGFLTPVIIYGTTCTLHGMLGISIQNTLKCTVEKKKELTTVSPDTVIHCKILMELVKIVKYEVY